jgi:cell division protein FtsZ
LVNISGSSDLTLHEAEKIVQVVADKLDPEANIIWGTQIDESLQNTVRTTVVVSGIKTSYDVDTTPEIEYAEEKPEPEATEDQLDDFIDGIF